MKFEEVTAEAPYEAKKWKSGEHFYIVELAYAFGQHRIQVWYNMPRYSFPDVLYTQF
jgi:hemolysin-activating ACP:hemolysin acyltransferase